MSVTVRPNQMISIDGRCRYGAVHHFGNPLDLEKILAWELDRLRKGLPTNVTITGVPYKAFYKAYRALRKERGVITVRKKCKFCDGVGRISRPERTFQHWSGVKIMTVPGLYFDVADYCKACDHTGYREFLVKPENKES